MDSNWYSNSFKRQRNKLSFTGLTLMSFSISLICWIPDVTSVCRRHIRSRVVVCLPRRDLSLSRCSCIFSNSCWPLNKQNHDTWRARRHCLINQSRLNKSRRVIKWIIFMILGVTLWTYIIGEMTPKTCLKNPLVMNNYYFDAKFQVLSVGLPITPSTSRTLTISVIIQQHWHNFSFVFFFFSLQLFW